MEWVGVFSNNSNESSIQFYYSAGFPNRGCWDSIPEKKSRNLGWQHYATRSNEYLFNNIWMTLNSTIACRPWAGPFPISNWLFNDRAFFLIQCFFVTIIKMLILYHTFLFTNEVCAFIGKYEHKAQFPVFLE